MEGPKRRLNIDAARVFGHQVQEASGLGVVTRGVNEDGFPCFVIERDVQIPVGIDDFFGRLDVSLGKCSTKAAISIW